MGQQILLVEGINDATFYSAFCREHGLKSVEVKTPKSGGADVDSKTNAIHILPTFLRQLDDASITNIGLVVDADYQAEHGLGFAVTLAKIREKVIDHGFSPERRLPLGGMLFDHPDGLSPFGAWIMPDNKHEGMLEDFIKGAITAGEQSNLHAHASNVVGKLRGPLFKPFHRSKADVATWLSWQRNPGARIESVIGDNLIDLKCSGCKGLGHWLHTIFD